MRVDAVVALSAVLLVGGPVQAQDQPFAPLKETFWRSADSDFPDGAVLMVSSDTLALSTACFYLRDFFDGPRGKPHFQFRADYSPRDASACSTTTSTVNTADHHLSETVDFRSENNVLTLKDVSGSKIAAFKRIKPDGLEFRWWAVTGYRVNGKIERLIQQNGTKPQMLFFNGTLLGSPGYGEFVGEYSLASDHLKISTGLYEIGSCCDASVEAQSNAILDVLRKQLEFKADGADRFALYDQQGNLELELSEEK